MPVSLVVGIEKNALSSNACNSLVLAHNRMNEPNYHLYRYSVIMRSPLTGNDPLVVSENARLLKLVDTKEGSRCGVVVEQVQLVCRQLGSFSPPCQCVSSTF